MCTGDGLIELGKNAWLQVLLTQRSQSKVLRWQRYYKQLRLRLQRIHSSCPNLRFTSIKREMWGMAPVLLMLDPY